jgi:hypothetical protein
MRTETRLAIEHYRDDGCEPGFFLRACLANDFIAVTGRADNESLTELHDIAAFLAYHVPSCARGSYAAVEAWMRGKRKLREHAQDLLDEMAKPTGTARIAE